MFLHEMSKLSWAEIEMQQTGSAAKRHRKHHGHPLARLGDEAQARIAALHLVDTFGDDELFRFRLSGERRLWGFRSERTFHVLWWDPDHQVYPTEK